MVNRRRVITLCVTAVLACSTPSFAQKVDPKAQQKAEPKLSDAQKKDLQAIAKVVDEVAKGQPAQNDLSLTWVRHDVLKAVDNLEFVPFVLGVDAKAASGPLSVYWRVVSKDAPAAAPAPAGKNDKNDKKDDKKDGKHSEYAYENFSPTAALDKDAHISRSFGVPAGNYDVFVVVREQASTQKNAPAPKMSVLKQPVTVGNLWTNEFDTSTVVAAVRIDPLPAPLTPQQQLDRPYAFGSMEIVPSFDSKFSRKSEISIFFLIYNAKMDAANKPDVTVEYNFHVKQAGAEKFFNKTAPQSLSAQTLPPDWDPAAGHQLPGGQAVPLASFPAGDYRLEIKVTDKLASKTLTREVSFTVTD
jgi:hypothetical protein